jgi:H/ACA ribonucleoprotein complex subunit 4
MQENGTLLRSSISTDKRYGKRPIDRSVEELIGSGFVLVDKPSGPSSHQITETVKNLLGAKKAGHLGTLDPNVSGVLPVLTGSAVKAAAFLMAEDKEYVGIMQFHDDINVKEIKTAFSEFKGEIEQLPPVKSAVARRLRKRTIHSLDIIEIEGRNVLFRTRVEAGTYIRKLVHDIGKRTGKGAHMAELRRTAVSTLEEKRAFTLHALAEAAWLWKEKGDDAELRRMLVPVESAVQTLGMKQILILDSAVDPVCSGAQLMAPGVAGVDRSVTDGDTVAVFTLKDELVAFGKAEMGAEEMLTSGRGAAAKTSRVMMERGTYPSWERRQGQTSEKREKGTSEEGED